MPALRASSHATLRSAVLPIPAGPSSTKAQPSPAAAARTHSLISAKSVARSSRDEPTSDSVPWTAILTHLLRVHGADEANPLATWRRPPPREGELKLWLLAPRKSDRPG